jgi:RHS repeat-associated protein
VTHGRGYTHDVLDRFASETHGQAWDKSVRRAEYTTLGRLKSATDERVWEEIQQVCPDPLDPMSCYNQTVVHTDTVRREVFTYDRAGNRTDRGAVLQTGNRLTSVDGYTLAYDDDGNLTSKVKSGVWNQTFTWNALGQLVQVVTNGTTTTFGYDGWGRRVRRTVGATRIDYVLDGDHVIAEVDGAGALLRSYAYYPGVDRPHSVKVGTQLYYYLTERPGHVTGLVNASNQLVNQYTYTAFGEPITTQEQVAQPFRFTGREYDSETRLSFHRARYYDPHLGRFISEDPIGIAGGINSYTYSSNNPLNATDPAGLTTCPKGTELVEIVFHKDGWGNWFAAIKCKARVSGKASTATFDRTVPSLPPVVVNAPPHLLYLGLGGDIIVGKGVTAGLGRYWTDDGRSGYYLRIGLGFGLDYGGGIEGGKGSETTFKGRVDAGCVSGGPISYCLTADGRVTSVGGGISWLPVGSHVERTWTFTFLEAETPSLESMSSFFFSPFPLMGIPLWAIP